jgi:putative MATE family efflux protein
MTVGKPAAVLTRFAIPVLSLIMADSLIGLVNGILLGRFVSVEAFAAISSSHFVYWLLWCIPMGMLNAYRAVFAQRFGARDYRGLNSAAGMALWIVLILGGAVCAAGILSAGPLLRLLGTPAEIARHAELYTRFRFAALPALFLGCAANEVFSAAGNSRTPSIVSLSSIVVNISLSAVFVLGAKLGVAGVGLAYICAQAFACTFSLIMLRRAELIRVTADDMRFNPAVMRRLLSLGLPLGLRDMPAALAALLVFQRVNSFGAVYVAGTAAARQMYTFLFPVGEAYANAISSFIGQNTGAARFDRVNSGFRVARRIMLVIILALVALVFIFRREALGLYITEEGGGTAEILEVALRQLSVILLFVPAYYMVLLYRAALGGLGDGFWPMISGMTEAVTRAGSVLLLTPLLGEWGLYLAEAAGWLTMVIPVIPVFHWKVKAQM